MTECNGCGRCCDPVMLAFTQDEVRAIPPWRWNEYFDPGDREWILNDLTPMTRREGLRLADYLTQGGQTMGIVAGEPVLGHMSMFYSCRHFDTETRTCTNYDGRPPMCSGYPWYGDPPDFRKAIPPECSYLEDVPVKLRALVRKP